MTVAITGFLIGVLIGMTGLGGGVLTAPLLVLFQGLDPAQSVGTALVFSAAAKVNSTIIYLVRKQVDWRVLSRMLSGGIPGALTGAILLTQLSQTRFKTVSTVVVGASVILAAVYSLVRRGNDPQSAARPARLNLLPWLSFPIACEVGFSSAGAGALGSVLLLRCTNLPPLAVVGTDLVYGLSISLVGGGFHMAAGNFQSTIFLQLLCGGLIGAPVGAMLAGRVRPAIMRSAILTWAVALGFVLLVQGLAKH